MEFQKPSPCGGGFFIGRIDLLACPFFQRAKSGIATGVSDMSAKFITEEMDNEV
jgi:hypothetical protein